MDKKNDNSCGCGGGSSNQFQSQGYKGSESTNTDKQNKVDNVQGKTCKSGQSGQAGLNDDVVYIETITAVYGPDDLNAIDDMDQDLNRRLNEDSENLTDM